MDIVEKQQHQDTEIVKIRDVLIISKHVSYYLLTLVVGIILEEQGKHKNMLAFLINYFFMMKTILRLQLVVLHLDRPLGLVINNIQDHLAVDVLK